VHLVFYFLSFLSFQFGEGRFDIFYCIDLYVGSISCDDHVLSFFASFLTKKNSYQMQPVAQFKTIQTPASTRMDIEGSLLISGLV